MYCPEKWHSLTSKTKSLDELKKCWLEIYDKTKHRNLKYKISLTGGEITINQDLLPFIQWLASSYGEKLAVIGMVTNGTANQKLYTDLFEYLDWISFSTHSEFFNENKFFNNVLSAKIATKGTNKTVHVNIMNEPWHQDRIEIYKKFLNQRDINFSVSEIDWSLRIRDEAKTNNNLNLFHFDDHAANN
jgi:MoaA/NifB/PqqE/SkfB family radical SAM enzyme